MRRLQARGPEFILPAGVTFTSAELLITNCDVDPAGNIVRFLLRLFEARVYRLR